MVLKYTTIQIFGSVSKKKKVKQAPFILLKIHYYCEILLQLKILFYILIYLTLDHKTSLKSLGYICSNSQKYTV